MAVYRCYVTKKPGFDSERNALFRDLSELLSLNSLESVDIFNRYDVEGVSPETFEQAKRSVFAEPQCDDCYPEALPAGALSGPHRVLAVESLPGQYDQRADSCAACIQLLTGGERPRAAYAHVYILHGSLSNADFEACRNWLINPVECREASPEKPETLAAVYGAPAPVAVMTGFTQLDEAGLAACLSEYGLAMDAADLAFLQAYFRDTEHRDPTVTELRVLDTYWSDHCRHTTFLTGLTVDGIEDEVVAGAFDQYLALRREVFGEKAEHRPVTLMDIATIGAKALKKRGILKNLDESDEINACTVKVKAVVDGEPQDWLLLFKNETHNHPTEIEPFGGAATCLGGAIRDPLSGRAYVYQAMRVTGSGDPRTPLAETLPGKLPQRRLTKTAARGYSSYGNQIGLATGFVDEIYHPGYVAKRLEIGAVVGAAPAENVRREEPAPGDVVIVLGGRTGRDGCGGATGSSKSHSASSLAVCGAEVQKGNPPEERKLQRLFRNPDVSRRIKRCNDFGAGGVSVAIGELADGLKINLNALPKKYEGLSGTELAISESQERMAIVVSPNDVDAILRAAADENVEASLVATVTKEPRLVMSYNGELIVDLSRAFVNSNGAPKTAAFAIPDLPVPDAEFPQVCGGPAKRLELLMRDLNICSKRGLVEMFDSSIGASSVFVPFGGRNQRTPTQVMAALLPVQNGETSTCSVMSYGFNPHMSEQNPFAGAVFAVTESLAKLAAAGCSIDDAYMTFQEYFERLREDPARWGKPVSALLGALNAQLGFGVASIGGKDSMSGSFENLDVPPTLVSFAVATADAASLVTPEFKSPDSTVCLFAAPVDANGLPMYGAVRSMWAHFHDCVRAGRIKSAFALTAGGLGEAAAKMGFGNRIGFALDDSIDVFEICRLNYGAILAETDGPIDGAVVVGRTTAEPVIAMRRCPDVSLDALLSGWEEPLSGVFPIEAPVSGTPEAVSYAVRNTARPLVKIARPTAVIPVFPGTNCEYDTARAVERAGGIAKIILVRNLNPALLRESADALVKAVREAQMIIFPGGFSGGDEPEGSGKFIASFFRNPALMEATNDLILNRDGLILGICNGFQALIKLGLVPFGEIRPLDSTCPTLTYNAIGLHRSCYVRTRVASVKSPWLANCSLGEEHVIPISHGEGRFAADEATLARLIANGQIAFQYVDASGKPSMETGANPPGSLFAIEGITSPDGRVLGKMGHTERCGALVGRNIPGNKFQPLFEAGVDYFR